MKKILFAAAVAMMALSSCGSKEAKEADAAQDAQQTEEVAPAETSAVVELADDNAYRPDTKVEGLVVLDFNATWCGPCKMLAPVFEQAAAKFEGKVAFLSVDIDKCPATAAAFGVQAVPTVVILRPDGKTSTFVGTQDLLPADKFFKVVQDNL